MNTDIRVKTTLHRHWKYQKLKRMLGESPMEYLVVFWSTVAEQIPNGALKNWDKEDVESACSWEGENHKLVNALLEVGFLDETKEGFYPHDWKENQPWAVGAKERSESARKAGKASGKARGKGKKTPPKRTEDERPVPEIERPVNNSFEQNTDSVRTPSPSPYPLTNNLTKEEEVKGTPTPHHSLISMGFNPLPFSEYVYDETQHIAIETESGEVIRPQGGVQ